MWDSFDVVINKLFKLSILMGLVVVKNSFTYTEHAWFFVRILSRKISLTPSNKIVD